MTQNDKVVRSREAMLAGMTPVLKEGSYFFCTTNSRATVDALLESSLAVFREEEGTALVLTEADALQHGFDTRLPMSRIVLQVLSALDGVGLTAAVATALADREIPCNVIAAYHHDNVFVPKHLEQDALRVLEDVQRRALSHEVVPPPPAPASM